VDVPDPSNYAVGKLYTTAFYRALQSHLSRDGLVVVQSTSPMFARTAFWSIERTLAATGLRTWPYHLYVPSFGEWGFVLAGRGDYTPPTALPSGLRYLTLSSVPPLFQFPADLQPVPAEANRLDDQALVRYYGDEWKQIER
jgi:spermidine synthase